MHWKHSNFQIYYLICGNCHTFDEAYRVLCELEEDRQLALDLSNAECVRAESKELLNKTIESDMSELPANRLSSSAVLLEIQARKPSTNACTSAAEAELAFIRYLKSAVQPHRKYKEFPDPIAHQLCQQEEWKLDLTWKAFNSYCSTHHIPPDLLTLIHLHPESSVILDAVDMFQSLVKENTRISKADVLLLVTDSQTVNTKTLPEFSSALLEVSNEILRIAQSND